MTEEKKPGTRGIGTIVIVVAVLIIGAVTGYLAATVLRSQSATAEKIVIAIQPTSTPEEISSKAVELEQFLESRVGVDVEIRIPTTYSAVIESLRFGHAQVGFMSAWPAYLANKLAGADIVLAEKREVIINNTKTVETYYFSYYVVINSTNYTSLNDVQGKKVAYTSSVSTSGYLYPVAKLVEENKIPAGTDKTAADASKFFGTVIFAGGYQQAWLALKSGQVDVSVIAGDVSESLFNEVLNSTRIIATQGPIPSHAIVYSKDFKEPLRSKLTSALLELGKPEYRSLMRKFISGIFIEFAQTTTVQHTSSLQKALDLTGFKFIESV